MNTTSLPIAVIGLNFGRHILNLLQDSPARDYFHLAAVCDLDRHKALEYADRFSVPAYFSLDELLDKGKNIGAFALFTGPVGRADLIRQIIEAGHDVMTTKPFELDPIAARTVLERAQTLGRVVHLNSPSPRAPDFIEQIHLWQREYSLGPVVFGRGETTASYREVADGRWHDDPGKCPVAPIFRLGIYLINNMVQLLGPVDEVQVQSSRLFTGRPTPDNAQLSLKFNSGALGHIYASFCVENGQHYSNALTLHFENGTIHRNASTFDFGTASRHSHLKLVTTNGNQKVVERNWEGSEGSGNYQWAEFYQAIQNREVSSSMIENVVHGLEVIQAMARAQESQTPQKIRP